MSGISGIYGDTSSMSLVDFLTNSDSEESSSILDTSAEAAKAAQYLAEKQTGNKRAKNAYAISASSSLGQAALNRALSEMGAKGGKVTFSDIAEYRQQLEDEFSVDIRLALEKAGVSLDTEFTLNMNADGNIQVLCDDPVAKEKIQKYLEDNPKVCNQFGYIQALANLERARQSPAGGMQAWQSVQNSKAEIQAQAVELFFSDALSSGMSYSSLLATFTPAANAASAASSTSFYAGIDYKV